MDCHSFEGQPRLCPHTLPHCHGQYALICFSLKRLVDGRIIRTLPLQTEHISKIIFLSYVAMDIGHSHFCHNFASSRTHTGIKIFTVTFGGLANVASYNPFEKA